MLILGELENENLPHKQVPEGKAKIAKIGLNRN